MAFDQLIYSLEKLRQQNLMFLLGTPKSNHKNSSKEIYLHFNARLLKLCAYCIININCLFVKYKQFSIYTIIN